MNRITKLLAATAIIAAVISTTGCDYKFGKVIAPSISASMSTIADKLAAGPVDPRTQESYYHLTDGQRVELLADLRRRMSDDQIKGRADVFAIVGHLYSDTTSAEEAARRDKKFGAAAQEYIAVGNLPQHSQNNPAWKNNYLGYSSAYRIGDSGCYATVISDLLGLWGTGATPPVLNSWSAFGQAHYAFASGTALIATGQAISYPNISRPWSTIGASDFEGVRRQLRAGHPVVVRTSWGGGHFMLVYCWDGNGFWVDDPWPTSGNLHPLAGYGSIYEFRLLGYNPV